MRLMSLVVLEDFGALTMLLVTAADSAANEGEIWLAEIYDALNRPRKALEIVFQGTS